MYGAYQKVIVIFKYVIKTDTMRILHNVAQILHTISRHCTIPRKTKVISKIKLKMSLQNRRISVHLTVLCQLVETVQSSQLCSPDGSGCLRTTPSHAQEMMAFDRGSHASPCTKSSCSVLVYLQQGSGAGGM